MGSVVDNEALETLRDNDQKTLGTCSKSEFCQSDGGGRDQQNLVLTIQNGHEALAFVSKKTSAQSKVGKSEFPRAIPSSLMPSSLSINYKYFLHVRGLTRGQMGQ